MSEEYQPGITELRLNAKAAIDGLNRLHTMLLEVEKRLAEVKQTCSNLIEENTNLKQEVQQLKAKLYEHGIR